MHLTRQSKEKSNLLYEIWILGYETSNYTDKAFFQEKLASNTLIFCTGILIE